MEVMESPIEALMFTYSVTAVTSLWTWLAVVTAALGLWQIRTIASRSAPSRPIFKHVVNASTTDARPPPLPTMETPQLPVSQNVEACQPKCQIASPKKGMVFKTTFCEESSLREDSLLPSDFGVKLSSAAYFFCDPSSVGRTSPVKASTLEDEDDGFDGNGSCSNESNYGVYCAEQKNGIVWNRRVEFYRFQDWTVLNGNVVRLWDKDVSRRRRYSE